jgi:hypothetical protein
MKGERRQTPDPLSQSTKSPYPVSAYPDLGLGHAWDLAEIKRGEIA